MKSPQVPEKAFSPIALRGLTSARVPFIDVVPLSSRTSNHLAHGPRGGDGPPRRRKAGGDAWTLVQPSAEARPSPVK